MASATGGVYGILRLLATCRVLLFFASCWILRFLCGWRQRSFVAWYTWFILYTWHPAATPDNNVLAPGTSAVGRGDTMPAPRFLVLRARVPVPLLSAVEAAASSMGTTVSAAVRELVIAALSARGQWPPAAQHHAPAVAAPAAPPSAGPRTARRRQQSWPRWSWGPDPGPDGTLHRKLRDLDMSTRSDRRLRNDGIVYVWQLASMTRLELLQIPGLGRKSVDEMCEIMAEIGLEIQDDE